MYGIIDIGSNTVRLSCYRVVDRMMIPVFHKKSMVGLAGYVDGVNNLTEGGIKKLIRTLDSFKKIVMCVGLDSLYVIATASLRNVDNSDYVIARVKSEVGYSIEILTGKEEATYDFLGATYFDKLDSGIVVDIGGGSTELVPFNGKDMKDAISVPIGSLSLCTKYVEDIFPTDSEEKAIRERVSKELDKIYIDSQMKVLGVGGSNRACLKMYNEFYDLGDDNTIMSYSKMHEMLVGFLNDKGNMLRQVLRIVPDRTKTILPGMIVLDEICNRYKCKSVRISYGGLREGYVISKVL